MTPIYTAEKRQRLKIAVEINNMALVLLRGSSIFRQCALLEYVIQK